MISAEKMDRWHMAMAEAGLPKVQRLIAGEWFYAPACQPAEFPVVLKACKLVGITEDDLP